MIPTDRLPVAWRECGDLVVERFQDALSGFVVYRTWEPMAGHQTITRLDGRTLGLLMTARLPEWLSVLPSHSDQRRVAVAAWHRSQEQRALAAIYASFPEAVGQTASDGDVLGSVDQVLAAAAAAGLVKKDEARR